jgi:hypothetical protein
MTQRPSDFARRYGRRLAIASLGALCVALPVATQTFLASALDGEKFPYTAEPGSTGHYETDQVFPGADAANEIVEPEACSTSPTCVLVPMDVKATPKTTDPFILTVTTSWDTTHIDAAGRTSSDIDVYFFTYRDVVQDDGTTEKEYVEIAQAATGDEPEVGKVLLSTTETVYIVVSNFAGVVTGFNIDVTYKGTEFVPAEEDLGEAPADFSGSGNPVPPSISPTQGVSTSDPVIPDLDVPGTSSTGSLDAPLGSLDVESDFASVNTTGLTDVLDKSESQSVSGLFATRETGPAQPVSSTTATVWLGLTPLLLLGAGAGLFRKLRPAALRA